MDAPTTDLVRANREAPELRDDEGGDGLGYMAGHVIRWDDWYEVSSQYEGRFMERIVTGAATKTIQENRSAIKVMFNHGKDPQLGMKILGPLDDLTEDDEGLRYGVSLFDTSYNRDLVPGLRAGVYGSSHRFRAVKDEWVNPAKDAAHNPERLRERTIREMGIAELGPVSFPASHRATAGVRSVSITDEWRAATLMGFAHDLATPTREPATETNVTEPQEHSGMTPGQRDAALRAFSL